MLAYEKTETVRARIVVRCGVGLSLPDAETLRRAELTLRRWAEGECGMGGWCIERDEKTGKPWIVTYNYQLDGTTSYRIPDREAGALRRVAALCKRLGLHYYHQTDPRGCALYVSDRPLDDTNYTDGAACCE